MVYVPLTCEYLLPHRITPVREENMQKKQTKVVKLTEKEVKAVAGGSSRETNVGIRM
jgi:hypothetical protein